MRYALQKQQEILKGYEAENADAHKRYQAAVLAGHQVVMKGSIAGPYTIRDSYYFSDGSFVTIISPASLVWAVNVPLITV